jgi:N-carbamoylputrescine amidase
MQTPKKFKVGLIQMSSTLDPEENVKRAIIRIEEAASSGAKLICLPELFRSQYFCQREDTTFFDLAEPIPGQTTNILGRIAQKTKVVIIAPIFERRALGIYHNSTAVIDINGEIVGLYRKMHIPDDPAYYEKFYFTPGDLGFKAIDTSLGRIGTLICWDQWYPEAARIVSLQGAIVLFYPTAIGWHPHEKEIHGEAQLDAWLTVQRGHAIANGVYVASVNRVGYETSSNGGSGIEFWGSSFFCDPHGVMVVEAGVEKEEILLGEVDLERIEEVRRSWPFLRDRRVDAYAGIDRRYLDKEPWDKKT